jgi:NHLM bacteriocin system ABC transporter ATP-binding protein
MSETSGIRAGAFPAVMAEDPVPLPCERIALDGRRPWSLGDHERVLRIVAGHVDLFAQPIGAGSERPRHHLFRVESGEIILGLPNVGGTADPIGVIAVGGPGTEVLVAARESIGDIALIEAWIARLGAATAGTAVDWTVREAEAGSLVELAPGEQLRAAARGVVWASCERGEIRYMGLDMPSRFADPPLPLASGTRVKAAGSAAVRVRSEAPTGDELWRALDRFHVLAMECIRLRLSTVADMESRRLADRTNLAKAKAHELFSDLARVIAPQARPTEYEEPGAGPLFAACRAAGDATGVTIVQPPGRRLARHDFSDVMEIARASRLRMRQTLLRPGWWRWNVGPLIAWRGEARRPVALIPMSRRYVMLEPGSPGSRVVDESLASELAAEAAMFYPKLPSGSLSPWDLLKFCTRHVRANAGRIIFGVLAMGALTLAAPLITQVLVNSVIPRTEFDQLGYLTAALIVVAITMASLQAMQGIAMLRLEGLLDWKLQAAIIDRLLRLPVSFFRQYTVGDLADRTLGIDAIRRVATGRTLRGLLAGVFGLFSLALMFYYDVRLAWIALALAALRGVLIVAINAVRLYHERRHVELRGKVDGVVLQLLTGVGKLRVAGATIRALAVWGKRFAAQKRHFIASQRAANVLRIIEAAFPTVATLIVFAAVEGGSGSKLALDLGAFLAFFAAFGQSMAAIGDWAAAAGESLIAVPYFSRIRPLMAGAIESPEEQKPPGELSGALELSRVTFRYLPSGPPVLDDVTIRVTQGEYVALVGPSGSGKSTIFRLLLGFEQPESGAIFFDGKAIDTLDIGGVRRQIGVVLQNSKLMTGSIYENICGGAMQLPMNEVWEAARLAGLDADIRAMPMGMHTAIAEGVSTLSGGQRQRLMIARALIRRPRLLLFDEATSALDNQTQSIVSTSLARLNVTRIVIAHRLSTVQHADRILVLVAGRLVQSGTFRELSASPGVFGEFAKRQLL